MIEHGVSCRWTTHKRGQLPTLSVFREFFAPDPTDDVPRGTRQRGGCRGGRCRQCLAAGQLVDPSSRHRTRRLIEREDVGTVPMRVRPCRKCLWQRKAKGHDLRDVRFGLGALWKALEPGHLGEQPHVRRGPPAFAIVERPRTDSRSAMAWSAACARPTISSVTAVQPG